MRSPALEKSAPTTGAPPAPRAGVDGLVRRLVKQLSNTPAAGDEAGGDVMLDVQVDGVRCTLVRVPPEPARPSVILSPREREIARMVARGYPNKTIAGVLDISSWTVSTYLRRVFAKLNVGSRAAMVARLMEEGLLKE
jgi:DNA-binding CsgD family transcriptional regulator